MYRYCCLLLMICAGQVHAWGATGHQALCQAAYELTAPSTQKALDALTAKQGQYASFAQVCTWADDIKKDPQWAWSKPLHYINVNRDETDLQQANCSKGCVLHAVAEQQQLLQQNPQNWQALFFLAHFVGDLHQPLHVSYADDWGGNKTTVTFFGEAANLHGIFDYGIIGHIAGDDWAALGKQLAINAQKMPLSQATSAPTLATFTQWGNESLAFTRQIYADYQPHAVLGQDYEDKYAPVITRQLEKGAQRLAQMLDRIYQP
ncbi:S1/P1 nuclease [Shewanella sp. YIC-542]|uniref:S1/P1 nuclease n=1 Tax=Shewanella mytili TaxID=3377111 RepID=UPI00398E938C